MQKFGFKNKGYKQFLVNNKSRVVTMKIIFDSFFQLNFFWCSSNFKHSIYKPVSKVTLNLPKKLQNLN